MTTDASPTPTEAPATASEAQSEALMAERWPAKPNWDRASGRLLGAPTKPRRAVGVDLTPLGYPQEDRP